MTKGEATSGKLPFSTMNYVLFLLGCLLLLAGFVLSAQGPHDGFLSLTLSPILLVFAYVVVIPAAILYEKKGD
ncbi:MAG: hypothetical protein KDC10_09310 [Calditrichaeota bacterium]|nr:hypothetical protein [Candidatus Cloacimonadota bacterium]MCA9786983.1 hypothetical protein [Candidatus Cloacimonadota bacterium]MCB1047388.1 hypothetical protein [Calditrichota bacterium]MCB9474244.1 hypothetical protein [Candidatus Delongbacteria bacterium]